MNFAVQIKNNTGRRLSNIIMKVSLYSLANHQEIINVSQIPAAKIRMSGEKNYYALVKIKALNPSDTFSYQLSITFLGKALSFYIPSFNLSDYSPQLLQSYTRGTLYWETFSPRIKEVADKLLANTKGNLNRYVRNVFLFVNQEIKLKQPLTTRYGASKALELHEGDCDELSDLFITLLRANKIPARRVVGYFLKVKVRENIVAEPHAWAEVYFPSVGWIPFDPALRYYASISPNHFARAKLGLVSDRSFYSIKWKGKKADDLTISDEEVNVTLLE